MFRTAIIFSGIERLRSWIPRQGPEAWYWLAACVTPVIFVPVIADTFELPKVTVFVVAATVTTLLLWYKNSWYFHPAFYLLLGFVLWTIVASVGSVDFVNSLFGFYARYTNGVFFFIAWAVWVISSATVLRDSIFRNKIWVSVVVVAALVALWGLVQRSGLGYYSLTTPAALARTISFMGNPNFSAMYLAGALPLAMWLYNTTSGRKGLVKWLAYVAVALISAAVIAFASRGAILGAVVGAVLYCGFELFARRLKLLTVLLFGALLLVLAPLYSISRLPANVSVGGQTYSTAQSRLYAWDTTVSIIQDRPWVGTSPGNYFLAMRAKGPAILSSIERFDDPHNVFLLLAASLGLPGLAFFLAFLGVCLYIGTRKLSSSPELAPVLAGIIGLLVAMCFNPVTVANWLLLGTFLGSIFVFTSIRQVVFPRAVRYALGAVLAVAVIAYALYAVALSVSDYFILAARTSYYSRDYSKALAQAKVAKEILPFHPDALNIFVATLIRTNAPTSQIEPVLNRLEQIHAGSSGTYMATKNLWLMLYRSSPQPYYAARAMAAADQLVALEPRYANVSYNAAYLYFLLENPAKAELLIKQAILYEPTAVYPRILLAKIYSVQGRHAQAYGALKSAYELDPLDWTTVLLWRDNKDKTLGEPLNLSIIFPDFDVN